MSQVRDGVFKYRTAACHDSVDLDAITAGQLFGTGWGERQRFICRSRGST
jgi:hypothetical protein